MKVILFAFIIMPLQSLAMNISCASNVSDDIEKTVFLNQVADCDMRGHEYCERIKASLPLAYNMMCQKPRDSIADFVCSIIEETDGIASSNVILELLECHCGSPVGMVTTQQQNKLLNR